MTTDNKTVSLPKGLTDDFPRVVCRARFPGKEQPPKELHYFCLQGLGELPRLMLEASETPYDSVMYFGKGEYKEFAPFGQLPLYKGPELDDIYLAQSGAICRHIARETGLDGTTVIDRATQDMIWELAKDIFSKKEVVHVDGPLDAKYEGLLTGAIAILQKSGGPYFGGSKFGHGDVSMFHSLYTIDQIKPGFIQRWEELNLFVTTFAAIPSISQYLKSPRRIPLTENELGKGHTGISGYAFISSLNPETVEEVYDK
jgi:glutathione S-transferase